MATQRSSRRRPAPKSTSTTNAPRPDWGDPAAVEAWLAKVRAQVGDAIGAGLDATAPPGERDLGRRMARQVITDAKVALGALLGTAE